MQRLVDTIFLTLAGVFFCIFALLMSQHEPAPGSFIICLFLSVGCFGLAGYRANH